MPASPDSRLNHRALVALVMLFSFGWLPATGIVLHMTDGGSISTLRHVSMSIHNGAGILFLLAAAAHLTYNARSIRYYIAEKMSALASPRRESIAAFVLSTGVILLIASHTLHLH